ncbi:fatty acid desaturase [Thermoflavimicrobium daqui]|jgi:omega-6 fatty acid desaturase (delta-12 desaturase)|uniref:Fatty acid desaturase n=1 Tax=Thermoflavimicrobium daqui TaxID=2137476 RepID=A0A364K219_9BACL|nr:fatty acid desaturase [Thermoflavimicrobium daqui]RAL22079.1 fatty acid desaturase [Thermoflavimicrobium daqui]
MSTQDQVFLRKMIAPFEKSNTKSSIRQLLNTFLPFFILWFAAYQSLSISVWLTLVLDIIASGFLVRIFIIFHDCCHQSFFKSRLLNDFFGTVGGIITLFPYEKWKRDHSIHHATSSNLNKRGTGDIWILTVDEYISLPFWRRVAYRLYRNPVIMFGLGPLYLFLISNRMNNKGARWKERINTYITNVSIIGLYALMCWAIGWKAFLLVQGPILFVSGVLGIWLFYVQHQFEDSYFEDEENWDYVKAAVDGSSYYKLPKVLQWITGNIGFHHVHHLSPKVPNYNLEKVHQSVPVLQDATTITLSSSIKSLRFRLWDEKNKTFVSFKDIKPLLYKANSEI